MTSIVKRPPSAPAVIHAEFVETPTGNPVPPPMPKPTAVRASAFVLLGTLIAAGAGVHRQPAGLHVAAGAVLAAVLIFLACMVTYETRRAGWERT